MPLPLPTPCSIKISSKKSAMDEPTGNLDPDLSFEIMKLFEHDLEG
jgi:hypothetical protein